MTERLLQASTPTYHIAELVCRRSIIYRLSGQVARSEDCIRCFQEDHPEPPTCQRANAASGRLHLSHLENLTQAQRTQAAATALFEWEPFSPPSPLEASLLLSRAIVAAKIFRCLGKFEDAITTLRDCLPHAKRNFYQAITGMADCLIDLDRLEEACAMLEREIAKLKPHQQKAL